MIDTRFTEKLTKNWHL